MMRKNINRNHVFTLDENDIPIVSIIDVIKIIKLNHQNHYSLFIQEMKFIQLFIHFKKLSCIPTYLVVTQ